MAAPAPTARGTPVGIPLEAGYPVKITISSDTTIEFWEKTTTPPGIDGGDPIEQTTQHNTKWRTYKPGVLCDLTPVSTTVAFDPEVYDIIRDNIINTELTYTVSFADGSTIAFFGFLQSFIPQEQSEREQPMADIVIQPTNIDPADTNQQLEAGYALAEVGSV